eukprot:TRINITY_DN31689_c0_g1_i2.p1 TRINITY_DN31689_c0_g1~~TRINITY_DN31689_c0_g1_i2.p1  ORF type:complete len:229 (+),score=61.37 TRINITY_DN31689_c0_g1_i2:90-776(+)
MIRRPPRSTLSSSSAASDVYKRQAWLETLTPARFFVASSFFSATGLVPTVTFNVAAGTLYGMFWGLMLFAASATIGAVLGFLAVRSSLRGFIHRQLKSYADQIRGFDQAIEREGPLYITILLRLSPVMPFAPANFLLGLTNIGLVPYALGTFIGLVPASFPYIYAGSLGSQAAGGSLSEDPVSVLFSVMGIVCTVLLTWKISMIARKTLESATSAPTRESVNTASSFL